MVLYAYHASHEQFTPSALVSYVRLAEQAGFTAVSSSEHLQPWSPRQGQSGFAWAWLGAAMQVTTLPCSVVYAPGQRYHPMIIAQAAATLAELFPGRFRLALGSGEALNERVIGQPWPSKPERHARLLECVDIMRALWAGETVTHDGRVRIEEGRLYTRALVPPCIFGAAVTTETARWVGSWADGLLTVGGAPEVVRQTLDSFYEGGGAGKPVILQVALFPMRTTRPRRVRGPMSSGGPTSSRVQSWRSCGPPSNLRPSPATCGLKIWIPPFAFRLTRSGSWLGDSRTSPLG